MNKKELSIVYLVAFCLAFIAAWASKPWYVIEPGFAGIHTRMGKVISVNENPGMYWMIPFTDHVVTIDMRIQKSIIRTEAFSHDLQIINLELAINHRIKDTLALYVNVGSDYESRIIDPFTQESVKAIIAKLTAEELTQQRNNAKEMAKEDLRKALEATNITLVDFNFIHVDFHEDFIKSVESKQIAEQRAKQAKFETERVKEEVLQRNAQAEAEAYSLKIQKEMATPELCMLKAIKKWDGKLPNIMTSDVSMLLNHKQ